MRNAFLQSILFHAAVVAISYFGFPYISRAPMITDTPIMVELVKVDELTNAPPPQPEPEKKKPEKKAAKAPPPPKPPKAATPPPPPPAKEKDVAMLVPDLKAKKKEKPQPEAKAPEKPEPRLAHVKPRRKPTPPDMFTSVLKTVEKLKTRPKEKEDEKKKKEKPESFEQQMAKALMSRTAEHNPMRPLAISEIDLVRQQIRECWNIPAGAKDAQDLNIEIHVVMNPDATVREARILNQRRLQSDPFFRAAAESALRAVLNPRCNPLKLPPDKYQQWQTMTLNFDPREMF